MNTTIAEQNRLAWNLASRQCSDSSIPVEREEVDDARKGDWTVRLTPKKPVPRHWFPELVGARVLCLAAGGGQQAPILAASGARVISLDLSEEQLEKDRMVAEENGLVIETLMGDMTNLEGFESGGFDLVFNPTSSLFIPDVVPLWEACSRILKPGGVLLAGSMNPSFFLFDHEEGQRRGRLEVKFPLPYSDLKSLSREQRKEAQAHRKTLEFGHTLEDLIGGQIRSGFQITGFYEDDWYDSATLLNVFSPTSFATRAIKADGLRRVRDAEG